MGTKNLFDMTCEYQCFRKHFERKVSLTIFLKPLSLSNSIFCLSMKIHLFFYWCFIVPFRDALPEMETKALQPPVGEGWFIVIVLSLLSSIRIQTHASRAESSQVDSHPRTVLALCYFTLVIKWEIVFPTCALANCRFLMINIFPPGTPVFQSADTTRICNTT